MVYAKSQSFQEKPGNNAWKADDESRSCRLQYTIAAQDLPQFWEAVIEKANAVRVLTIKGDTVAYFENPKLLFQSHDLKNTFCQPTLENSLKLFQEVVLKALCPDQLDGASCWIDIGTRDYVSCPMPQTGIRDEPRSILWRSGCHHRLHERLAGIAPEIPLNDAHFRSFLLRDIGTYLSKAKITRTINPGHPETCCHGLIRAKAYNCNKELFSVMFSDYRFFSSGFLPLLALSEQLIKDLEATYHKGHRVLTSQLTRASLLCAWEANKRHLRAMSESHILANYGARREITLRLDAVLRMFNTGYFSPSLNPHVGVRAWDMSLTTSGTTHYPFWVIPTKDINQLIYTQTARLILPLDHLFQEASLSERVKNDAESSARLILAFYTAQLFCRLLAYSVSSEQQLPYDNWIWHSKWTVRACPNVYGRDTFLERQGLGLEEPLCLDGMLWIPQNSLDWYGGNVNLAILTKPYIPRSPFQTGLASQANMQLLSASMVTVELFLQDWVTKCRHAYDRGKKFDAEDLAKKAMRLAVEEISRSYHRHMLAKLQMYWSRVRRRAGGLALPPLKRLCQAMDKTIDPMAFIVNAQAVLEIYTEAWTSYSVEQPGMDVVELPSQLPCWMVTRKYLPPKDGWSSFIFEHLFNRTDAPTWNRLEFLNLCRRYKGIWVKIQDCVGSFDERFRGAIGKYILVSFNSDRTKEVGTNHNGGCWHEGLPTFFRIQYYAPYFLPPESNFQFPWLWIPNHDQRQPNIPAETTSTILTPQEFQAHYIVLERLWLDMVAQSGCFSERTLAERNNVCLQVLDHLMIHAGPRWEHGDKLPYVLPWECPDLYGDAIDHDDIFRLPTRVSAHQDKPCRPTLFLPTRHNILQLVDTVESMSQSPEITRRIGWIRSVLDSEGQQYSLASHIESKCMESSSVAQSASMLRLFLSQSEPPQRVVRHGTQTADMQAAAGIIASPP